MKIAFRDVKDNIRNRIIDGVWPPGDLIPNEVELALEFGCARATVNRAVQELAEEGIVERKRKVGTRVLMAPRRKAQFEIPVVRHEIETAGQAYRYALVSREVTDAPVWLQEQMSLKSSNRVLHLTCIHYADDVPYQYEDRWINLISMPAAGEADFSKNVPTEWLVETVPFSDAEISFSATAADELLAKLLGCTAGQPLFLTERSTWWQNQAITYVRLTFRAGHKLTTRY